MRYAHVGRLYRYGLSALLLAGLLAGRASAIDLYWDNDSGSLFPFYTDATFWSTDPALTVPAGAAPTASDNIFFLFDGAPYSVILSANDLATDITATAGTVSFTGPGGELFTSGQVLIDDASATGPGDAVSVTLNTAEIDAAGDAFVGDANFGNLTVEAGGDFQSSSLYIGDDAGSEGVVTVTSGATVTAEAVGDAFGVFVGNLGTGTLNVESGGVAQTIDTSGAANFRVGVGPAATGTINLSGAGSQIEVEDFLIGVEGSGTLNVSAGGVVTNLGTSPDAFLALVNGSTADALVTGDDSVWNMRNMIMGRDGDAVVDVLAGGRIVAAGLMTLGEDESSDGMTTTPGTGTLTVDGSGAMGDSTVTVGGILTVGELGQGTLTVSGGGDVSATGEVRVGENAAATFDNDVTVTGAGSTLMGSAVRVGTTGRGALDVLAGAEVTATGEVVFGESDGADGDGLVDGMGSRLIAGAGLRVGNEGFGTLSITNGGFVQAAILAVADSDVDNDGQGAGLITISGSAGGTPSTLNITTAENEIGGTANENGGVGVVNLLNGGRITSNGMIIGSGNGGGSDGDGEVNVSGAGTLLDADANGSSPLIVGGNGRGVLAVSTGARVEASGLRVGDESGSDVAQVNLSGSGTTMELSGAVTAGFNRRGGVNITNGAVLTSGTNNTSSSTIGFGTSADGAFVSVDGEGSTWDHRGTPGATSTRISVGRGGGADVNGSRSLLSVTNGGQVIAHDLLVADGSTAGVGQLIIDGQDGQGTPSRVSADGFVVVGDDSFGRLNISGGGVLENTAGSIEIGGTSNGSAVAVVNGAGSMISSATFLTVGRTNDGVLFIENGGTVSNTGNGNIGRDPGAVSTVTVGSNTANPSTWNNGASLFVGGDAGGAGAASSLLVQPGGVVNVTNTLRVWLGTATLAGGTISLETLDLATVGDLQFNSGTLRFTGNETLDSPALADIFAGAAQPTLAANQHLEVVGDATLTSPLRLNAASASFSVGATADLSDLDWDAGTLNLTAQSLTVGVAGLLSDSVVLDSQQALGVPNNTLTVEAGADVNILRGGLSAADAVNDGLLVVSKTTEIDFDADDAGAGLTNNGDLVAIDSTIAGPVVNNGSIEVVGTVNFTDGLTLSALGGLGIDLNGVGDFDAIAAQGDVSLDGDLIVDASGLSLTPGDSFEIIDVEGSLTGSFAGLPNGASVGSFGGVNLLIDYAGGDGNDVVLTAGLLGDFDGDGDVDVADALAGQRLGASLDGWESNFGAGEAPLSASAVVPEPNSALAFLLLACGLGLRRKA